MTKKYCVICGEKIGLLGNRKLEDGVGLDIAFPLEEIEEYENYMTEIEVGESLTVAACYTLISDSPVEIDLLDTDGTGLGAVFEI